MRFLLTIFASFFVCFSCSSQTITIKIPEIGDKTYFSPINEISEKFIFKAYNNETWDYSRLIPTYIRHEYFSNYRNEIGVNKCNLVYHKLEGEKEFYIKEEKGIKLIGVVNKSNFTKSEKVNFNVIGDPFILTGNLTIEDDVSNYYKLEAILGVDELNSSMNFLPKKIDSVRIVVSINKTSNVKGISTLNLYNMDQNAVLIESSIRSDLKMFIQYSHENKWFEYNYNRTRLPSDLAYFASKYIDKTYEYYTEKHVMPVLKYLVRQSTVENVYIQDKLNEYNIPVIDDNNKSIIAYPNPAINIIHFNLINYPRDSYRLEISNILGIKIKAITINPNDNNQIRLDVSDLYKGIYLYKFVDGIGRKSPTQRFMKTGI